MKTLDKRALALCIAALLGPAHACGPDFPPDLLSNREQSLNELPRGMFAFEAAQLVKPTDSLRAARPDWSQDPVDPEQIGLAPGAAEQIARIRETAANPDEAYTLGAGLPEDVRLYTAGAVAWHQSDLAAAQARFTAVLGLPDGQFQHRGVWAAFMLGRLRLLENDLEGARTYFQQTRSMQAAGGSDPHGLAIGTWGAEAAVLLAQGDYPGAVALYAEQAARDDDGGRASLLIVARKLMKDPDALRAHIADPLVQRLVSSFAYSGKAISVDYYDYSETEEAAEDAPADPVDLIVAAVDAAGLKEFAGADRLAAAAYVNGRYDLAARFLPLSDTALAQWVDAKLKLRAGDTAGAAQSLARASKAFALDESWTDPNGYDSWPLKPQCRVAGEEGVLKLSRGEYLAAAEDLFRAGDTYWADLAYVADRVLTLDELSALTTRLAPTYIEVPKTDEYANWPLVNTNVNNQLRYLTARRLLRAGKSTEALALFDNPDLRKEAQRYVDALQRAQSGDYLARARQLTEAAAVARQHGMEILGFEGDPDYQIYGGSFDLRDPTTWDENYNPVYNPRTDIDPGKQFVGPDEARRLAETQAQPLARFHYRHLAAKLAQDAAALVPPRSQAYAALMCRATAYVVHRAPEAATTIYRTYLKNGAYVPWGAAFGRGDSYGSACPAPDFDKAQAQLDAARRAKLKRIAKYAGPPVLGVLLLGIGFWWWRKRRKAVSA